MVATTSFESAVIAMGFRIQGIREVAAHVDQRRASPATYERLLADAAEIRRRTDEICDGLARAMQSEGGQPCE